MGYVIDAITLAALLFGAYWFVSQRWKTRWQSAMQCPHCGFVTTHAEDFTPVCAECGEAVPEPKLVVFRYNHGALNVKVDPTAALRKATTGATIERLE